MLGVISEMERINQQLEDDPIGACNFVQEISNETELFQTLIYMKNYLNKQIKTNRELFFSNQEKAISPAELTVY